MNIEEEKLELTNWISCLKDYEVLKSLQQIKQEAENKPGGAVRKFGDGKYIIRYIADDFNEPLDDFKEYIK